MKKTLKLITLLAIMVLLVVTLTGCTSTETGSETININRQQTAEDIVNTMKEKNANIGRIVVYTSETDLNKLLGRPGQYISKVTFEDKRIEQTNANLDKELSTEAERNEPTGGTIEVFENKKDMENRKQYIEGFSTTSMFSQYVYSKGNALLRVDGDLTPEQANEYETVFNEIIK